jgi:Lipopolysaccharide-assembly
MRSGVVRSAGALALAALAGGCLYSFHGGGMPAHIKTVAVLPFDNRTGEPALTQEVYQALQDAVGGRLGLRQVNESQADAIVRGEITNYQPDIPLSYQAGQAQGQVEVTRRRVQITVNVEIYDTHLGKALWQQNGLTVDGEYTPPAELDGRKAAEAKLVTQIVEGAQSQW